MPRYLHNDYYEFDWYEADIMNTYDYYAFGMMMPGRGMAPACDISEVSVFSEDFSAGAGSFLTINSSFTTTAGVLRVTGATENLVGAYKQFAVTGGKPYTASFNVANVACSPVTASILDQYNNVVATATYATTGIYTLTFTPATSGTHTIQFTALAPGSGSTPCRFTIDDVAVSYSENPCANTQQRSYRFGFNGQ